MLYFHSIIGEKDALMHPFLCEMHRTTGNYLNELPKDIFKIIADEFIVEYYSQDKLHPGKIEKFVNKPDLYYTIACLGYKPITIKPNSFVSGRYYQENKGHFDRIATCKHIFYIYDFIDRTLYIFTHNKEGFDKTGAARRIKYDLHKCAILYITDSFKIRKAKYPI